MRRTRATAVLGGLLLTGCSLAGCLAGGASGEPVPAVTNQYPADAVASLTAAGLRVRFRAVPAIAAADAGINGYAVVAQDPAAGTRVASGGSVTLTLLNSANGGGPPPSPPDPTKTVGVPSVIGLDPNAAISELTQLGLLVDVAATGERTTLAVVSQTPRAATVVSQGSHVTLGL